MVFEAGYERPQDCRVEVELAERGGVVVELSSKIAQMFGKSMERSAMSVLEEEGVAHATVRIFDCGSLDFTVRGRTRTAVRRAKEAEKWNE